MRRAAAGVTSEQEFFDRLAATGLLVSQRVAPSGDLLGYKVALPDDRNEDQEPIYDSGSTLAPNLSLPRIRERWAGNGSGPDPKAAAVHSSGSARINPSTARRQATAAVWQAVLVVDAEPEDGEDRRAARRGGRGPRRAREDLGRDAHPARPARCRRAAPSSTWAPRRRPRRTSATSVVPAARLLRQRAAQRRQADGDPHRQHPADRLRLAGPRGRPPGRGGRQGAHAR
ncbi:hypothetical protein SALBM311S_03554 [Streptomyces alboniger]